MRSTYYQRFLTPEQRFWSKVDPCRTDGCALWLGSATNRGYGQFTLNGKITKAHHFLVGKPPTGLVWDHVKNRGCTHKTCVWPEHLELVTTAENNRRADSPNAAKTHCPQGHSYTDANTYRKPNGWRSCRICTAASHRRRRIERTQAI